MRKLHHLLADPAVCTLLSGASPAMLVDEDGNVRFANAAAASLLGAPTTHGALRAPASDAVKVAVTRLLGELGPDGVKREVVDLQANGTQRRTRFTCLRIALPSDRRAIFFADGDEQPAAILAAGTVLSLLESEREPLALLDEGGGFIHATPPARALLGDARFLSEIAAGASLALARARDAGEAEAQFGVLRILLRRISDPIPTLLALFSPLQRENRAEWLERPDVTQPTEPMDAARSSAEEKDEPDASTPPVSADDSPELSMRPARFVWQSDAEGRISSVSSALETMVGSEAAAIQGLNWTQISELIGVKPVEPIVAAMATHDTWSGITVSWPVNGSEVARQVDLGAVPFFNRERRFAGYRGFGVFREAVETVAPPPHSASQIEPPTANEHAEYGAPAAADKSEPSGHSEPPAAAFTSSTAASAAAIDGAPTETDEPRPTLTPAERTAFREIARVIGARLRIVDAIRETDSDAAVPEAPAPLPKSAARSEPALQHFPTVNGERAVLDRLPLGVVVHRGGRVLYANRAILDWIGVASTVELAAAGLERLFAGGARAQPDPLEDSPGLLAINGRGGELIPVEARLFSVPWEGETALVYVLRRAAASPDQRVETIEFALRDAEATVRELRSILDTATDGVALIGRDGSLVGINRSAEALFGYESAEVEGKSFTALFAPDSQKLAADYLDGLAASGVASVLNDGREVMGRVREGGLIPLFMTIGRVGDNGEKFCAVFRDITQWKRTEEELVHARRRAERASSAKSDFLAKISHEIRTPLNAILGFSEVMMQERFGPVGNERYREYLKDIYASGEHLISLVNDLLDLSKIEAGKLELKFSSVDLNDVAGQCMAIMQPQANRERIIIRTALAANLPPVVADTRSIRQIVLNLLSNSIKFTPPGGQVIVSTMLTDEGEVHLRVRDTGIGMSEAEVTAALEPFRQLATTGRSAGGTGLGLPLTKALAEANRASFSIKSSLNGGTLVQIAFPSTRVLAE